MPRPADWCYEPRGAAEDLLIYEGPEALIAGPAGTGKSVACLMKMHVLCCKYPGIRALICRKTRASLTTTGLVTFEEGVLKVNDTWAMGCGRQQRRTYKYPNGSVIDVGGVDEPTRIMSSDYDLIYIQEATELKDNDWEMLSTRLRNGKLRYQQIYADCNPDSPQHWLKKRCDVGKARMLESRHEDNPVLYDLKKKEWTPLGESYIAKLDALSGARRLRLRFGRWVQAEGVVYEGWDRAIHVIDPFPIPESWTRLLIIDFGFTNPFCAQWVAKDPDSRLYLYREWVRCQMLVEDHARKIKELAQAEPRPQAVVCDHDAEDRATLERHLGWTTTPAWKSIPDGIQFVAARLRKQQDGHPRLKVFSTALVDRCPHMDEAKKPIGLVEEMDSYIWPKGKDGKPMKEVPVDDNNHSCDAIRYAAAYYDRAGAWVAPTKLEIPKKAPLHERPAVSSRVFRMM